MPSRVFRYGVCDRSRLHIIRVIPWSASKQRLLRSLVRRFEVQTISGGPQRRGAVSLCLLLTAGPLMLAQTGNGVNLQIKADQVTAKRPPTFHGLMTEERGRPLGSNLIRFDLK